MPTRADIEAATPKCPSRRTTDTPQCARLLTYDPKHEVWCCVVHGRAVTCTELVAVQEFEYQMAHGA